MAVRLYVGAIAALAAIVATVAALVVPASYHPGGLSIALMVGLVAVTSYVQIRYYHHDEVDALNLMEGMLAPVIFACAGLEVALITAVGVAAGNLLRRNDIVKVVFNMSQWVLCACVGSLVLHALSPHVTYAPDRIGD